MVFGTTVSTRPADLAGSDAMIGLFINTVPVRARLDPARSLLGNLARFQEEQSELFPHQFLGLSRIQQLAGVGDLFDTTMVFENFPAGGGRRGHPRRRAAADGGRRPGRHALRPQSRGRSARRPADAAPGPPSRPVSARRPRTPSWTVWRGCWSRWSRFRTPRWGGCR
ncbi:condensation domain-containing protein [Streptomyces tricolor]|nr:condensation domain-containing protein [Streptomyces tricolor]